MVYTGDRSVRRPRAVFTAKVRRTTSPWRTRLAEAVSVLRPAVAFTTSTGITVATPLTVAVSVVFPAPSAVTTPSLVTFATAGFALFQVGGTRTLSPSREMPVALSG